MAYSRSKKYLLTLILIDGIALILSWLTYYYIRIESGVFPTTTIPEIVLPMIVVGIYWFIIFWIFGLYRPWYAKSRLDELIVIVKTVTFGVLILFFLIFIDDALTQDPSSSRLKILLYWALLLIFVGGGRLTIRSVRRRMLVAGIGHRNTLLIGKHEKASDIFEKLRMHPGLGYRIIGYLSANDSEDFPVSEGLIRLGDLANLEEIIRDKDIEEIIITLDSTEHEKLLNIIGRCSAFKVGIKILPDLYDIISGQAKTNQLYGIPLIEVTPELMAPWEEFLKRTIDIVVSLTVLISGLPLFALIALAQKLTTKGPILYKQERVGLDKKTFMILKFRTMYVDAEQMTGPQWAVKDDPRVTPLGRILRKMHLDELPQVINVLDGDMSIVGPRPERPYFVNKFIEEIPLYRRRLNVRPGITGWAQVKYSYDQSIEDVRTKLSYDLFYIENMSIRMDLKILFRTLYNVVAGKGHT